MELSMLPIVIGIILAFLVSYALGIVVIFFGLVLMLRNSVRPVREV